ncbi:MAG: MFS transporter [Candidatus Dormibacteraeota bacterium]|nr:MFS transporter [Candidatus Dormibacteraeota bacterium]
MADGRGNSNGTNVLYGALDNATLNRRHWYTVLTAGMGFFTDAYDLFIIGTVTAILTPIFHLTLDELSLLNSISLLASVVGALLFGRLMDVFGRKAIYGTEMALLVIGALASAFTGDFLALFLCRIVVGIGVGGDYATSAVITAEYANRPNRGRLIGTVFAMQGFGLLAGPLFASVLLATGVPANLSWRIMLAFGAVPAISVIYLRRRIKETPRFSLAVKGDLAATEDAVKWTTGRSVGVQPEVNGSALPRSRPVITNPVFIKRLIGTAGCWMLMDMAFYGNGVSSQVILKALFGKATLLHNTIVAAIIFAVFAVPGYWVAVWLMDKIGRKRIQWQGFLMMAIGYGLIWVVPGIVKIPVLFLVIYGITYFFVEFGPNETTFVYPAEIFPTAFRGFADGISAGGGKFGAFVAALLMPTAVKALGLSGSLGILAGVSVVGVALTLWALPEPKGRSLEDAGLESYATVSDAEPQAAAV